MQPAMEAKGQANGGKDAADVKYVGYSQPAYVSGWMYVNEQGQYCGPYIQEQLFEGLSTKYLPEDLPVYPVLHGNLGNPVPLKYFQQFPEHVATGFVFLTSSASGPNDKNIHGDLDSKKGEVSTDAVSIFTQQIPESEAANSTFSFPSMVVLLG